MLILIGLIAVVELLAFRRAGADAVFNGEFKLKDVPFRKQKRFDYQREFRICIQTLDGSPTPRTFNIESLPGLGR